MRFAYQLLLIVAICSFLTTFYTIEHENVTFSLFNRLNRIETPISYQAMRYDPRFRISTYHFGNYYSEDN